MLSRIYTKKFCLNCTEFFKGATPLEVQKLMKGEHPLSHGDIL